MIKGLYTAASGMVTLLNANDNLANNLANINTTGFKKGITLFKTFAPLLIDKMSSDPNQKDVKGSRIGSISGGCQLSSIAIDFEQGHIKKTDNDLDLALQGEGFFEVRTTSGETAYTRDGSFERDLEGYLVTREGNKLIGSDNKPIRIDEMYRKIKIGPDGTILEGDRLVGEPQVIGRIKLVEFENKQALTRQGNNLYVDSGSANPAKSTACRVIQGAVEASNANVIDTMSKSIAGMRAYETLARVLDNTSKNLEKTVNQLGKV
ncbi:MAG: flagellar basal-body rod protein FlgF [Cyanobacteriota bacterium]